MGGAPFERYTFILHIGKGAGGGGMEHANSTAIGVPSDEFMAGAGAAGIFYFLDVKTHRPPTAEPGGHPKEQNTRALWVGGGGGKQDGAQRPGGGGIWSN